MSEKTSPLPWRTHWGKLGDYVVDSEGKVITTALGFGTDAALIVRAVNNFAQLTEACTRAEEAFRRIGKETSDHLTQGAALHMTQELRAAMKKAKQ